MTGRERPWQTAAGQVFSVAHVTAAELITMRAQVLDVMAPYAPLDPAERPPGALPVRVMMDLYPWFEPGEAQGGPGRWRCGASGC